LRSFALTVFLSAFLLFLVQPVMGKYILPWFGSTPSVWTTCLLFFQTMLLGGYAYAHLIVRKLSPQWQVLIHLTLIGFVLLLLPITPSEAWKPGDGDDPTAHILLLLLATVGGPFLILASTGPLLQAWFARTYPGRSPYRLYALSNIGSFLALIAYPMAFERFLQLEFQTITWSIAWAIYAVAIACCAWKLLRLHPQQADAATPSSGSSEVVAAPGRAEIALWIGLAACSSGLLMATTNRLCLDVAVFPLLWVVPLGIYLLTFVVCFERDRWYSRPLFCALLPVAFVAAGYSMLGGVNISIFSQVAAACAVLFACCMCCHGELAKSKPHPQHLTLFYLAIAAGGALGGVLVAIIAPAVLHGFWEFHLLIILSYALILVAVGRDLTRQGYVKASVWSRVRSCGGWLVFVAAVGVAVVAFLNPMSWPGYTAEHPVAPALAGFVAVCGYVMIAVPALLVACVLSRRAWRAGVRENWMKGQYWGRYVLLTAGCILFVPLISIVWWDIERHDNAVIDQHRNFYGVMRVSEYHEGEPNHDLTLFHGRINHGFQLQSDSSRGWPTAYYSPISGVGLAIRAHPKRSLEGRQFRIGVIGLGVGTIAAYANSDVICEDESGCTLISNERIPGDHVAFYEINPLIDQWSLDYFSFRSDALNRGAEVVSFIGDARIVMERQLQRGSPQDFDVLVVDAFSGDAVPVHLMTTECFETYLRHLATGGVLAVHVTNRYLTLAPVVRRLAESHGYSAVFVETYDDADSDTTANEWVLISANTEFFESDLIAERASDWPSTGAIWTDSYSSIFSVLKRHDN